jgi:hypothetical protein
MSCYPPVAFRLNELIQKIGDRPDFHHYRRFQSSLDILENKESKVRSY